MELRKICEDTSDMGMWELAHNFVFIKDKEAWYRDFEREVSALNLMREIIGKHGDPERISGLSDQELNDTLMDDLQYGTDDLDGVFATLYMALWGMAEVRGWLKQHEESGLPAIKRPEVLQEAVAAYGTHAQVDMAIEEMSELTKALCKERRCGFGQGSRAQAHANIIEEIADVIIMLAQLLIIFDKDREIQKETDYKLNRLAERLAATPKEAGTDAAQGALQPAT
jgi:NTP pyrophosphatase (non-canonical NTP hydrolase)